MKLFRLSRSEQLRTFGLLLLITPLILFALFNAPKEQQVKSDLSLQQSLMIQNRLTRSQLTSLAPQQAFISSTRTSLLETWKKAASQNLTVKAVARAGNSAELAARHRQLAERQNPIIESTSELERLLTPIFEYPADKDLPPIDPNNSNHTLILHSRAARVGLDEVKSRLHSNEHSELIGHINDLLALLSQLEQTPSISPQAESTRLSTISGFETLKVVAWHTLTNHVSTGVREIEADEKQLLSDYHALLNKRRG